MLVNIPITSTAVPIGFCFIDWQTSLPHIAALLRASADLETNIHIGDAPPTDLSRWWARTIAGVPDRLYGFQSGVWLAKHPIPVGFTMLAPAGHNRISIAALDGGDGDPDAAVGDYTGPMWAIDTDFEALFPIGPGTLASGNIITEGDAGGAEEISLTIPQIPPHSHQVLVSSSDTAGGTSAQRLRPDSTLANSEANTALTGGDSVTGLVAPHPNLPPWRARYFIKKTGRTHYRI